MKKQREKAWGISSRDLRSGMLHKILMVYSIILYGAHSHWRVQEGLNRVAAMVPAKHKQLLV